MSSRQAREPDWLPQEDVIAVHAIATCVWMQQTHTRLAIIEQEKVNDLHRLELLAVSWIHFSGGVRQKKKQPFPFHMLPFLKST
eukprot:m.243707 g.243707  ORF g.243707 m.243707 type:complete len:84 (+) comp19460_c0_seq1:2256-2507(+)